MRAPVLADLFQQLWQAGKLQPFGLNEVLDWRATGLDRVDRGKFLSWCFNEGEAVPYFFELSQERFETELGKQLGVR